MEKSHPRPDLVRLLTDAQMNPGKITREAERWKEILDYASSKQFLEDTKEYHSSLMVEANAKAKGDKTYWSDPSKPWLQELIEIDKKLMPNRCAYPPMSLKEAGLSSEDNPDYIWKWLGMLND